MSEIGGLSKKNDVKLEFIKSGDQPKTHMQKGLIEYFEMRFFIFMYLTV